MKAFMVNKIIRYSAGERLLQSAAKEENQSMRLLMNTYGPAGLEYFTNAEIIPSQMCRRENPICFALTKSEARKVFGNAMSLNGIHVNFKDLDKQDLVIIQPVADDEKLNGTYQYLPDRAAGKVKYSDFNNTQLVPALFVKINGQVLCLKIKDQAEIFKRLAIQCDEQSQQLKTDRDTTEAWGGGGDID